MKFLRYIWYDIISNFRSREGIISLLVFPIALMTILGISLKAMFQNTVTLETTKVIYVDNSSEKAKQIFNIFKDESKSYKVELEKVESLDKGKDAIKTDNSKVLMSLDGDNIVVYENNQKSIQVDYVISSIKGVSQRYNVYTQIAKISPQGIKTIDNDFSKDYTKLNEITVGRDLTSYDYYGVVEITVMVLYGALFTSFALNGNKNSGVVDRITQTGNSKLFNIMGIIISKFMIVIVTLIPSYIFSRYVLNVYWGNDNLSLFLIFLSLNFFSVTLGAFFGIAFKDEKIASMLLNTLIIPVLSFLGGSYMYIADDVKGFLGALVSISPLRWSNRSMMNIIYSSDYSRMPMTIGINMVLGLMFIIAVLTILKKREA